MADVDATPVKNANEALKGNINTLAPKFNIEMVDCNGEGCDIDAVKENIIKTTKENCGADDEGTIGTCAQNIADIANGFTLSW